MELENFYPTDFGTKSLGSSCRIELTLNYPRTAAFKRMSYEEQKQHYDRWIHLATACYTSRIKKMQIFYEKCKSGDCHVHLDIHLYTFSEYYPCGLVSDWVRSFLSQLPVRHGIKNFSLSNYHCGYRRYRCPPICCQIRDIEDEQRALVWETYIRKDL